MSQNSTPPPVTSSTTSQNDAFFDNHFSGWDGNTNTTQTVSGSGWSTRPDYFYILDPSDVHSESFDDWCYNNWTVNPHEDVRIPTPGSSIDDWQSNRPPVDPMAGWDGSGSENSGSWFYDFLR
jgi:hypothetical protein